MNRQEDGSLRSRRTGLLDIPFPSRLNSAAGTARWHTLDWLDSFGLLSGRQAAEEYDALRLERLMAYFYPDAGLRDLELATDLNGWFFVFDDQFDSRLGRDPELVDALVGSVLEAMDGTGPLPQAAGPLAGAFRDLWRRASDGMPELWRERFREHWREYLRAYRWEAVHRTSGEPLGLAEFLHFRRRSIGVQPCLDLAERCCGRVVPEAEHRGPELAALRELTADVVLFVNDLVSLEKEMAAGDVNNSVLVLRARSGCSLDEAALRVGRLANARVTRFQQLSTALPGSLTPAGTYPVRHGVESHVEAMRHLMRGNLTWSLETPRYDPSGADAVSDGRPRPWAGLFGPVPPAAADTASGQGT